MADATSLVSSQGAVEFGQPAEWLQLANVDRGAGAV
jgi:hypothetical protein